MAKRKFWIYYNSTNLMDDFRVDEFGIHVTEPNYDFSEKRINYIIHFVVKGVCHLTVGEKGSEKYYVLREGEAFLMRAGTQHTYRSDKDEGCTRHWLSFSGKRTEEILRRCGVQDGQIIIRETV